jgi:dihydrodipicolinate synthase/N-acetylneuraminate lyase
LNPAVPVAYHAAIAEVGLPLILFQLQPALAGVNYENDVLQAMAEVDGVVAIKEASFDARPVRRHGTPPRAAAEEDHAAHRQRQLHP